MRQHTHKGFSLIEVTIAMLVLMLLAGATFSMMDVSAKNSDLVFQQTRVQVDAQRILRMARDELRKTTDGGTGDLTYNPSPPTGEWEFRYRRLSSDQSIWPQGWQGAGTGYSEIPWSAETFILRYEITDGGNPVAGEDDNGNLLVDEGRLVLLMDDGATVTEVAVLGERITSFTIVPIAPIQPEELIRYQLNITMEEMLRSAVSVDGDKYWDPATGTQVTADLKKGFGPKVRYTGSIWVTVR